MNDYKLAKTNLKRIRKNIHSPIKSDSKEIKEFFKLIRPDKQTLESDNFSLSWKVKPKIDFSDLIDGDYIGAVDNTEVKVKIVCDIDEISELRLEIKGKPFRLDEDCGIKLSAITYF
jgi:hypothetical protein